jgi:hypothetical protein
VTLSPYPWSDRLRRRWQLRRWRYDCEEIISRLTMAHASIHQLREQWFAAVRRYDDSLSASGGVSVFTSDLDDDRQYVTGLELTLGERTIERAERRLDYRSLARASVLGALAGAVAGAAAGSIVGFLLR